MNCDAHKMVDITAPNACYVCLVRMIEAERDRYKDALKDIINRHPLGSGARVIAERAVAPRAQVTSEKK